MIRLIALLLALVAQPLSARTILFVGNSFTQGVGSAVLRYRADSVEDLNGDRLGGVPALFKRFADQRGLDWQVALETAGGRSLGWHLGERRALIDRPWDAVVLQEYSTLNAEAHGDPAATIAGARGLAALFRARNDRVAVWMNATWARPDIALRPGGSRWSARGLRPMTADVRAGHDAAAAAAGAAGVVPTGQAFLCAIAAGVADADPYDGIAFGRVPLWTHDQYHGSAEGYYLEALVVFASVTGEDPRSLGRDEAAAGDLGLSPDQAAALQAVAWDAVRTRGGCAEAVAR
ncbi:hypothetical protein GGR88_002595 [Sphingomonas jejuensis]|uniref:PEP-CTERM sorting domain-containing protein n=1 Tax=Sphingomonas jejuensis TaxID=904715 RepID=A0ABX0XNX1_9SPHN|nr:PEP-CTERM sorting domain-containing protein [Sphingomonas jejuensis]NJC35081.1 hypothetical protein [Sphingomonas jejuensis]